MMRGGGNTLRGAVSLKGVRIARVIAKLEPGGAQLGALRLSVELERHFGVSHTILAGQASSAGIRLFERAGLRVETFGGLEMQYAVDPCFANWIAPRVEATDLVHAHMFGAWWAAACTLAPSIPLIASEHNALRWPGQPREHEMSAALARVDRFCAHGPASRALAERLGLPPDRLVEGISAIPDQLEFAAPPAGLRSPRIVYAGRLHEEKGPDLLLAALELLAAPPATYLLGAGPLEDPLRDRVSRNGLAGRVHFCGWRERVGRWLAGASVCVVPSRQESWSQTAVHAMALGVPVVGTAVEGLPQTLADGRGLIVAPEDPEALAAAIADLLTGRRVTDLDAARDYAARFGAPRIAARYAALYAQLLDRRVSSATEALPRAA